MPTAAAPLYNHEGVLLHCGATIVWSDGRRANFQCAFDQVNPADCLCHEGHG